MRRLLVVVVAILLSSALTVAAAVLAIRSHRGEWVSAEKEIRSAIRATIAYTPGFELDVHAPTSPGHRPLPIIVMLHGCCGSRFDLGTVAEAAATGGALVFNADWAGIRPGTYPAAYGQAACAVRVARMLAGRFGGDPGRIALLGWSDGAMVAAVVGEAGERFPGPCAATAGSPRPDAVVGVAGFLGWPLDGNGQIQVGDVSPRAAAFFGGTPATARQAWLGANPYTVLGNNPDLAVRLVVGVTDPLLADNQSFAAARRDAGLPVSLVAAHDTGGQSMLSPRTAEGRITVREALAAVGITR